MSAIGQAIRSLYDNKTVYSLLRYGVPVEIGAGKITDRNWLSHCWINSCPIGSLAEMN